MLWSYVSPLWKLDTCPCLKFPLISLGRRSVSLCCNNSQRSSLLRTLRPTHFRTLDAQQAAVEAESGVGCRTHYISPSRRHCDTMLAERCSELGPEFTHGVFSRVRLFTREWEDSQTGRRVNRGPKSAQQEPNWEIASQFWGKTRDILDHKSHSVFIPCVPLSEFLCGRLRSARKSLYL